MADFLLPDLGEGLTQAGIVSWLVGVGDEVRIDQPVVEVETAKATVEVPVPFAGIVTAIFGRPGDVLAVGSPLISVLVSDPAAGRGLSPKDDFTGESSGSVLIGYGTPAARGRRRRSPARSAPAVISPLVRRLARDSGVRLTEIVGTGAMGIIRRADVEHAISHPSGPLAAVVAQVIEPAASAPMPPPADESDLLRIPMTGIRRLIADKMTTSRREIPEATVWVDVDATELLAAREIINNRFPDRRVSILAMVARFAVLGLRRYPELNGRIEGREIVIPSYVHLGLAAHTDRGVVVPVVHHAEKMSARDLSAAIVAKATAARAGKLAPQDISGSTFTLNNYGVFGVDGSAAIINHPEVAMLGMGRIIDRPWVVDDRVVPRKLTQLSLVFDHRACDGGVAGGFLRFVADCIEAPVGVLADL